MYGYIYNIYIYMYIAREDLLDYDLGPVSCEVLVVFSLDRNFVQPWRGRSMRM